MEIFPSAETGQWAVPKKLNIAVSIIFVYNSFVMACSVLLFWSLSPKQTGDQTMEKLPLFVRPGLKVTNPRLKTRNFFFFIIFLARINKLQEELKMKSY